MENYIKYKLMGGNKKLKRCAVPHISQRRADRKRAAEDVIRNVASQRTSVLSRSVLSNVVTVMCIQIFTHHEYIYF
jgi:hypothetical protein